MKSGVLDICVWISGILDTNPECSLLLDKVIEGNYEIFISSYGIAECINVLRRLSTDLKLSSSTLERNFWSLLNQENIKTDFTHSIKNSLLAEIRNQTEIKMLAETMQLEPKDVPFVMLAYKNKIPLITEDYRSLWNKRRIVDDLVGLEIFNVKEWLKLD